MMRARRGSKRLRLKRTVSDSGDEGGHAMREQEMTSPDTGQGELRVAALRVAAQVGYLRVCIKTQ
jgi:hypothetical protein